MHYSTLSILIDDGALTNLRQILDYVPIDVLAADLGVDAEELLERFFNAKDITMGEINKLAELIDCDFERIAMLAVGQFEKDKES